MANVQTGPRGGRYVVTKSGARVYLKDGQAAPGEKQGGDDKKPDKTQASEKRFKVSSDDAGVKVKSEPAKKYHVGEHTEPKAFADAVKEEARAAVQEKGNEGAFGDRKVFIAHLWARMKLKARKHGDDDFMSLDKFKEKLMEARSQSHISLVRADYVTPSMNHSMIKKSETKPHGWQGSHVNFVSLED